MSERFPGGIISKTAPVPTGPYETGTAPGIWTLDQQAEFVKQGIWPIAGLTPNYIEDVFSTWLYTGNGSTQTITNGIDLAGEGGLVWLKNRSANGSYTEAHGLFDTTRGAYYGLNTNGTGASSNYVDMGVSAFNADGFNTKNRANPGAGWNNTDITYASWTFRKQPKFFDVVTYTGNGVAGRTVAHNLGSVPGCMIIKVTSTSDNWAVYHRSLGAAFHLRLNATSAATDSSTYWNNTNPTATEFTLGTPSEVNTNGATYVAYLFAHNAGGFGLSGEDNVISCGSYNSSNTVETSVDVGFEPQFIIYKNTSATGEWYVQDVMRGNTATGRAQVLRANNSAAEFTSTLMPYPTATGFNVPAGWGDGSTYIYIAIRRGPMKVPTDGTSVYTAMQNDGVEPGYSTSFTVDSAIQFLRQSGLGVSWQKYWGSRLTGTGEILTSSTAAEQANSEFEWDYQNGFSSNTGTNYFAWLFRRAPSVFDVVCYTGNGDAREINHNLTTVPEMMIVKERTSISPWSVYVAPLGPVNFLYLNTTDSVGSLGTSSRWNSSTPTSTLFSLSANAEVNEAGQTYVAYLFASCPGVSKVGSYTGTGTTQQINCGFTAGARFVLIKRTDSTGDWYVWDSARGIVAGDDPYLLLNTTDAEVTGTDYVDTYSAGFEITSTAPAAINASGGSFIFLAIA